MSDTIAKGMLLAEANPSGAGESAPAPADGPAPQQAEPGTASPLQPGEQPAGASAPAPDATVIELQAEPAGLFQSVYDGISGFLDLGGPVVALLLVLSIFALTVILLKLWQFYVGAGASGKSISRTVSLWLAQDYETAIARARGLRGPVARVVTFAMVNAASRRNEDHMREETEHVALSEVSSLRSYLRGLEAVVQVAPLLGLFGTVLGMIEAFRSLEAAGTQVNPADLAGGIWVALLTTAVGLAIAMPVSLVLHWFESRIARVKASMELFATEVMTNPPVRAVKPVEGARVRLASAAEGKNAD